MKTLNIDLWPTHTHIYMRAHTHTFIHMCTHMHTHKYLVLCHVSVNRHKGEITKERPRES